MNFFFDSIVITLLSYGFYQLTSIKEELKYYHVDRKWLEERIFNLEQKLSNTKNYDSETES